VQVLVERMLEQIRLYQKVQVLITLSLGLVYQEAFAPWDKIIDI